MLGGWVGALLVLVAAAIALVSAVGMSLMRDPLQRLHFVTPPATLSAALVAVAFWMEEAHRAAAAKVSFAMLVLFLTSGVASQATARAIRNRCRTDRA